MDKEEILEAIRTAYNLGKQCVICARLGRYESSDEAEEEYLAICERVREEL